MELGKKKVEAKYIISGNACIFCTRRTKAMHVKQCIARLNGILGTKALHFYTRLKWNGKTKHKINLITNIYTSVKVNSETVGCWVQCFKAFANTTLYS